MKVVRFSALLLVWGVVFLFSAGHVSAQQSGSSASVSQSRAINNSNPQTVNRQTVNRRNTSSGNTNYYTPAVNFRAPDEVAVEEFVNYHKHRLPLPKVGQSVAMDTRWGNNEISTLQREAVLQIGFTTAEVTERTDLRPLNLALVIDKSGSMAEDDKMSRVKESDRKSVV